MSGKQRARAKHETVIDTVARILARMRKDDADHALKTIAAGDDGTVPAAVKTYYQDDARVARTPREILSLHIAMLLHALDQATPAPRRRATRKGA